MVIVAKIAIDKMPEPCHAAGASPHSAPPRGVHWLLHHIALHLSYTLPTSKSRYATSHHLSET